MAGADTLREALRARFGDSDLEVLPDVTSTDVLHSMAARGSCRAFQNRAVGDGIIRLLCAAALASPTKSDLQQRDIVVIRDDDLRTTIAALVADQAWIADVPSLLIFCGNNRRQRLLHEWRGHPFANDHLDAFFNAAVDAGIALSAFVIAAESIGLGCCPISAVRNRAQEVSDLLKLPPYVFPVAGLALGHPVADTPAVSMRLPLSATVHTDTYGEAGLRAQIETYDRHRESAQPYAHQRFAERYGETRSYGWSEDKTRQYSRPERADFGRFIRGKGFDLG